MFLAANETPAWWFGVGLVITSWTFVLQILVALEKSDAGWPIIDADTRAGRSQP